MLGKNLIQAAAGAGGAETDENFANTVLLLHGDGNQGATNFSNAGDPTYLAFKDNSSNNFPITVNGDAYGDNFGPFALEDGNWSNYFDGNGDYLSWNSTTGSSLTGDFTAECWVYPTAVDGSGYTVILGKSGANVQFTAISSSFAIGLVINGTSVIAGSGSALSLNEWHHLAWVREGSTCRAYVNGVQAGTGSSSATVNINYIGRYNTGGFELNGYMSNLRVLDGTCLYPSGTTFTPPTSPLTAITNTELLTCQSNRFVDNSSNNFTITPAGNVAVKVFNPFGELPDGVNGSGYFDGSSDFLSIASDPAFQPDTGDFSVSAWVYPLSTAIMSPFGVRSGTSNNIGLTLNRNSSGGNTAGNLQAAIRDGNVLTVAAGITPFVWQHIIFCKTGNLMAVFVDGVRKGSLTENLGTIPTAEFRIGDSGLSRWMNGYISNCEFVNGSRYDATQTTVTIPSAPITTPVANTSLLTCQYAGTVRNVGFIDSGPYDFPITRVGNTTQGSFSPFSKPDGAWGNYFGSGFLQKTSPASYLYDWTSTSFTLEFWIYVNTFANNGNGNSPVIGNSVDSGLTEYWSFGPKADGKVRWYYYNGGSVNFDTTSAISSNEWHHLAFVNNAGSLKIYVDGVADATGSISGTPQFSSGTPFTIGKISNVAFDGYLSNVKITQSAVYTSDFTPSTSPLTSSGAQLLTCQSNRFVDNSTNQVVLSASSTVKVTPFSPFPLTTEYSPSVNGGSGYFDGSGDYITTPNVTALNLYNTTNTVECWVYLNSVSTPTQIYGTDFDGSYYTLWQISDVGAGGYTRVIYNSRNGTAIYTGAIIKTGQWYHLAWGRSGNTVSIWVNGIREANGNITTEDSWGTGLITTGYFNGTSRFNGFCSNLRVVKGTDVYGVSNTTITIPTAPLTAIANTSLLCNFTNAGIYDNTGFNVLETVGNAQIDTSVVKFGTGAMKFDGSGDYCVGPNQPWMNFGSGDLTIECWVRFNSVASTQMFVSSNYNASTGGGGWTFGYRADNTTLIFSVNANVQYGKTWSPSIDTWYFVTVCREGTSLRFFVDGTQIGTTSTSSDNISGATTLMVGSNLTTPQYLNGYIDDLRITKGVARYTSNFTVPDKSFPNIGV